MARIAAAWSIKKGEAAWKLTEQVRISPAPKLGGWVGRQLRLLSVSRGQSIIIDLEQGSLAVNRRSEGLPSMQRMWFPGQGFSLGYTKPRASPEPAELFFLGPDAKLWARQRLPAPALDAAVGTDEWLVACRNGRVHAFGLDGTPLWSELIPCARRDEATNEFWGLPVFHPRLHLAANSGLVVIGAEHQLHRYDASGERIWSGPLPGSRKPSRTRPTMRRLPRALQVKPPERRQAQKARCILPEGPDMPFARSLAGGVIAGVLMISSVKWTAAQELAFDVASVKPSDPNDRRLGWNYEPGRLIAQNLPLVMLIALAYDLPFVSEGRVLGGPGWARSDRFDVEGKAVFPARTSSKDRETKMKLMLQTLLSRRFKLVLHRETKEMPIYSLVVARNGPKLQKARIEEKDCPEGRVSATSCHVVNGGMGRGLHGKAVDLSDIVLAAGNFTDRPLVDATGLKGLYEIDTQGWADMRPRPPRPDGQPTEEDITLADPTRPTLFMIFDRLGLKMEATKGPVETFTIEYVEKPAAN